MEEQPPLSKSNKIYVVLCAFFVTILVLTNMIGTKLFVLFGESLPEGLFGTGFVLTTGIITYPFTFWFTDIVSEIWGKKRADFMVFIGFGASMLMLAVVSIAKAMPPSEIWQLGPDYAPFFHPSTYLKDATGVITGVDAMAAQAAFSFTFDAPGILLFSSMLAYLVAQLIDNRLYHFWKRVTKGKHLWLRNNGSTAFSQLIDTIIVNSIFLYFYFKMPFFTTNDAKPVSIFQIIATVYLVKLILALLDTPLIYLGVFLIKRYLGIETEPNESTVTKTIRDSH